MFHVRNEIFLFHVIKFALSFMVMLEKSQRFYHMDFSQGLLDRIKTPHNCISKSSCLQMFYKGVIKKFVKFTGRHLCRSFFIIKLQAFSLQRKCLPVNFAKFFRRPTFEENCKQLIMEMLFLYNISERLLLYFREFNLCTEKILEFPVKPATLLTVRLFYRDKRTILLIINT